MGSKRLPEMETFDLEVNLKRFAAVAISIDLWEKPFLVKERKKFFKKYAKDYTFQQLYVKWSDVREIALNHLKTLRFNLSPKIKTQLESAIVYVGDKIFDWVSYILKSHGFGLQATEKIYWTPHGTVNDAKILRLFWQNEPAFPFWENGVTYNENSLVRIVFYNMCSSYALTDILEANRKEVLRIMRLHFYKNEIKIKDKATIIEVMAMLMCNTLASVDNKRPSQLYKEFFGGFLNASPAVHLFYGANDSASDRGTEYFYGLLTKKEREEHMVPAGYRMLGQIYETDENGSMFKKERLTSMILFMINHMSEKQKKEFLLSKVTDVCQIFIAMPPYDKLCRPFMEYVLEKFPDRNHTQRIERLLDFTFKLLVNFPETSHPSMKEVQQEFFEFLYNLAEEDTKKKVIVNEKITSLSKLFKSHDFPTLKLILNDPDLVYAKKEILGQGKEVFQDLADHGKFKLVDLCLNQIFTEDRQRKKFKAQLKFTANVFINGKVDLSEKFLDWIAGSSKKKQKVKQLINPFEICSDLIRKRHFNLANEYLSWQLDYSVDDQAFVKSDLKSKILLSELCKLWCEEFRNGIGSAKTKCNQLLKFFGDERAELIENDEEFVRTFFLNIPSLDCVKMIDDLLRFCLKSSDKIKGVKQKIAANINSWIEFFSIKQNKFLVANSIIFWLFKGNKKDAVIKNFINSSKGAELCVKVLTLSDDNAVQIVLAVYNNWVKCQGDKVEIKKHLENNYGESSSKSVLGAKALLDHLISGRVVTSGFASKFMDVKANVAEKLNDSEEDDDDDDDEDEDDDVSSSDSDDDYNPCMVA